MAARVTLADVSERAGVAVITCSRVLNGSKVRVYIADETRERVLDAAKALGYRRSMTAGATRTGRVGAIGLIGISSDHTLPRALLWGVEEAAASRDLHLILAQLRHGEIESDSQLPRMLRERAVDGLLVFGFGELKASSILAQRIESGDTPVVRLADTADVDSVRFDARSASAAATDTLIHSGHKRIAFAQFSSMPGHVEYDIREGYQQVMREAGLSTLPLIDPELNQRLDHQQAFAHFTLRQADRPSAIVACGQREAEAYVIAAMRLGLDLPNDLAVFAISDAHVEVGGYMVSTILLPYGQLARTAVRMLGTKIERPERRMAPQVLHHRVLPGLTI